MICRFGMSEVVGPIALAEDDQQYVFGRDFGKEREYGEETASLIDNEMKKMVNDHYEKAKKLLLDNIEALHSVAKVLMEEETIDGSRILAFLGKELTPES